MRNALGNEDHQMCFFWLVLCPAFYAMLEITVAMLRCTQALLCLKQNSHDLSWRPNNIRNFQTDPYVMFVAFRHWLSIG